MPNIRVSESTLICLKELKKFNKAKSHDDLIFTLLEEQLKDNYAYTQDGYLPAGSVVLDGDTILVIKSIINGRVIFDDFSYANNGSKVVYRLRKLADSVEEYDGGRANV